MSAAGRLPVIVVGGSGYVSGELLRLLAAHPVFEVVAAISTSQAGQRVETVFPQLTLGVPEALSFKPTSKIAEVLSACSSPRVGVFLATPHGSTAGLAAELISVAAQVGKRLTLVDLSADFRFEDPSIYSHVYNAGHGAPELLPSFFCGVPELSEPENWSSRAHIAHPGCFTTAVTLAAYPLIERGLVENDMSVAAVTGSSGSGRKPGEGTHHPERSNNLTAYSPLSHRHEAEMRMLLNRAGGETQVSFVPHSGPFVRGIHATVFLCLRKELAAGEVVEVFNAFYHRSPFVSASVNPPRLIDVVGTNACRLGVAVRGRQLVVLSAIDNMVKGAAGGGIQWLNRLFALPDETGLLQPGLGWY